MNDRIAELWLRQLDGRPLTRQESEQLAQALIDDPELGVLLLEDAATDDLLRATSRLQDVPDERDEPFVGRVMTRIHGAVEAEERADCDCVDHRELDDASATDRQEIGPENSTDSTNDSAIDEPAPPPTWNEPEPPPVATPLHRVVNGAPRPHSSAVPTRDRRVTRFRSVAWLAGGVASLIAAAMLGALLYDVMHADAPVAPNKVVGTGARTELPTPSSIASGDGRVGEAAGRPRESTNTRRAIQPVVWRSGGPRGEVLPPGRHELVRGSARVRLPDDVELELDAPTLLEVLGPESVDLQRGRLRVRHVPESLPLRLTTPVSEIRELDGVAELSVADEGETDIRIQDGQLMVVDRRPHAGADSRRKLSADRFNRARLSVPVREVSGDAEPSELAFSEWTGPDDQFLGQISVDGRVLEFGSPATFEATWRQSLSQFQQTPEEFVQAWLDMVRRFESQPGAVPRIEFNGRHFDARNGDAVFGFQFWSTGGAGAKDGNESFEATVHINGKTYTARSREEFEALQKELRKSWPAMPGLK